MVKPNFLLAFADLGDALSKLSTCALQPHHDAALRGEIAALLENAAARVRTGFPTPDFFGDIEEFHRKFDHIYEGPPRILNHELRRFRFEFMIEEIVEWDVACTNGNLHDAFDALIDLAYVLNGTIYLMGFVPHFNAGWRAVHEANMSKTRAVTPQDSKRNSVLDVVKPPGWTPPDHSKLLSCSGDTSSV